MVPIVKELVIVNLNTLKHLVKNIKFMRKVI